MQDAAVVIDVQMRIIQVNAAAQRLLLSGSPELLGKEIHQIIKTDARIADLLTHESVQMELPIPHAESSSTYEVHLSPL
jgi:PAS domain-containing protein